MTRRHIPKDIKEQLVVMSGHLKSSDIARVTHTSRRTVNRVLRLKRETGSVVRTPFALGRPRVLNGLDVAVRLVYFTTTTDDSQSIQLLKYIESLVERTPDIFMAELQFELQEARGVHASSHRIREAMRQRGFTRKCVRAS